MFETLYIFRSVFILTKMDSIEVSYMKDLSQSDPLGYLSKIQK